MKGEHVETIIANVRPLKWKRDGEAFARCQSGRLCEEIIVWIKANDSMGNRVVARDKELERDSSEHIELLEVGGIGPREGNVEIAVGQKAGDCCEWNGNRRGGRSRWCSCCSSRGGDAINDDNGEHMRAGLTVARDSTCKRRSEGGAGAWSEGARGEHILVVSIKTDELVRRDGWSKGPSYCGADGDEDSIGDT